MSMADWAAFIAVHIDADFAESKLGIDNATFDLMHEAYTPSNGSYSCGGWCVCPKESMGGKFCITHGGSNTFNLCEVWARDGRASLVTTNNGGC